MIDDIFLVNQVADKQEQDADASGPTKKGRGSLIIGLVLALVMGGAGFFAGSTGLVALPGQSSDKKTMADDDHGVSDVKPTKLPNIAFVEIEPVLIALAREPERRHLRFRGHLEVNGDYEPDVSQLMPRILDVLNSYLRAVEIRQLEDPAGLSRLRAQMLRRVQIVTGEGRVRDLLISEFVLN